MQFNFWFNKIKINAVFEVVIEQSTVIVASWRSISKKINIKNIIKAKAAITYENDENSCILNLFFIIHTIAIGN